MTVTNILLLPGWQDSDPAHWQSRWEARYGDRRVEQHDWMHPLRGDWSARLEEEVVVTRDGCEVITRFPSEKLLVAGTHYFTAGGPLPTTRETQSNLNNPGSLERVKR